MITHFLTKDDLRVILKVYSNRGYTKYEKLLKRVDEDQIRLLIDNGYVTPCGEDNAYLVVSRTMESAIDYMLNSMVNFINAGVEICESKS